MRLADVGRPTLSVGMGLLLVSLLFLMGLELTLDDLRRVSPRNISKAIGCLFVVGPLCGVALCHLLALEPNWALAILLASVTPPTVGASVNTFIVGGDTALALATSVLALLSSFVLMPACFAAEVALFNALAPYRKNDGGGSAERVTLRLPLAQIATSMALLVCTAAAGLAVRARTSDAARARLKKRMKRALGVVLLAVTVSFWTNGRLVGSTFYGGARAHAFWMAAVLVHLVAAPFALATTARDDTRTRDAVVLAVVRRNPILMIGVAALSFRGADGVDFDRAFGLIAACMLTIDWVTVPIIVWMRYARYGRLCNVATEHHAGDEAESKDGDDEAGSASDGALPKGTSRLQVLGASSSFVLS